MKEKIIIFIVGLLLGAIISTGSIYFYTVANNKNNTSNEINKTQMPGGNPRNGNNNMNENGNRKELPNNNQENKANA